MVIGYHVIFSTYGFWLPNDPRGSWSDFVGAWELYRFGPATKTNVRHSVARVKHDVRLRQDAKKAMKHPPVKLTGIQARAVANGFASYAERSGIQIWACAILPEHVHMVIGRHTFHAEYIVNQLKGNATRRLLTENLHPASKCWSRGQWKVFLNTQDDVRRAIRYVENNPLKENLPPQRWNMVHPCPV